MSGVLSLPHASDNIGLPSSYPAHLSGPVPSFGPVATLAVCSFTWNDLSQCINTSIGSFEEPEVPQCIAPPTQNNALCRPGLPWDLRRRLPPLANSHSIHGLLRNLVKVFQAAHTIPLVNERPYLNRSLGLAMMQVRRPNSISEDSTRFDEER